MLVLILLVGSKKEYQKSICSAWYYNNLFDQLYSSIVEWSSLKLVLMYFSDTFTLQPYNHESAYDQYASKLIQSKLCSIIDIKLINKTYQYLWQLFLACP